MLKILPLNQIFETSIQIVVLLAGTGIKDRGYNQEFPRRHENARKKLNDKSQRQ